MQMDRGSMGKPVLILSNSADPHSDAVIHFLNELEVPVVRWHPGELVTDAQVSISADRQAVQIESSSRSFDASYLRSVWYRRPEPIAEQVEIHDKESKSIAIKEAEAFARGLYYQIDAVW